jgi:hypothetical protein
MIEEQKIKVNRVKAVIDSQIEDIKKLNGINSLILSVCLVDTLAGFYAGYSGDSKGNKTRYLNFVKKYLNKYEDHLYGIRCNLTHSFSNTVSKFIFIDNPEFGKVYGENPEILGQKVFDISIFKNDLEKAKEDYFSELISDNIEIWNNFLVRYDSIGILGNSKIGTARNSKGEFVSNYDDLDTMPGLNLKIAYWDPTNINQ